LIRLIFDWPDLLPASKEGSAAVDGGDDPGQGLSFHMAMQGLMSFFSARGPKRLVFHAAWLDNEIRVLIVRCHLGEAGICGYESLARFISRMTAGGLR
jgi:hypothetical protein